MGTTGSSPNEVVILPYLQKYREYPAPYDDWGYYEGLPTPALSPLMPYNTVPWFYRNWMFDKIKEPRYGFAFFRPEFSHLNIERHYSIISKSITNDPTLIMDYHLIAIRKQIEQLFSPFVKAYIILDVHDSLHYPPVFWVEHNRFQRSWWIAPAGGMEDGIGDVMGGHVHCFRDNGPTGRLYMRQNLTISQNQTESRDGSIRGIIGTPQPVSPGKYIYAPSDADVRSSYGNYYLLSIEPRWTITEYWRKAFLEDWSVIQNDYASTTSSFQQIMWGPWAEIARSNSGFSPVGYALAYSLDYGAMWESEDNIVPSPAQEGVNHSPKVTFDEGTGKWGYANGPIYSACTRPHREFGGAFVSGSDLCAGAVTKSVIGFKGFYSVWGFNCGIFTNSWAETAPESVPSFPDTIQRPHAENILIYDYNTSTSKFPERSGFHSITYEGVGEEIEITPLETSYETAYGTYYAHCLGAHVTPYYRITIMNFNGLVFTIDVRETEVYYHSS